MSKEFDIKKITRQNVLELKPYSSARSEFKGHANVFLDANESPYHTGANRYPDPVQTQLKNELSKLKKVPVNQLFIGNGSDEIIDLLFRAFTEPEISNVIVNPPSFGMYKVAAQLNDINCREVLLTGDFQLDIEAILRKIDENTRIIFICSPNNPTGNRMKKEDVIHLLQNFENLVVVDEAYIDFSEDESLTGLLNDYPNLVILQTLSKGWGMAGARIGIGFASNEIVATLTKMKMPYNVSEINQKIALDRLLASSQVQQEIAIIIDERELMRPVLESLDFVEKIFPTDANFLLLRVKNAKNLYQYLLSNGIVIRDRSNQPLLENCVRITVGLPEENEILIEKLFEYQSL